MIIEFDLLKMRPYAGDDRYRENPFTCEIKIIDDRGKEYKHKHEGWWFPETEEKITSTNSTSPKAGRSWWQKLFSSE